MDSPITSWCSTAELPITLVYVSAQRLNPQELESYKVAHPHEFSGKFEGDMIIEENGSFRSAERYVRKWVDGVVPYDISSMSEPAQDMIRLSLNELQTRVGGDCIKFVEKKASPIFGGVIKVFSGTGCYSNLGRRLVLQKLSLNDPNCISLHIIQHEFLHAIGFIHEQSRRDRDQYLDINWGNIENGQQHNFLMKDANHLGTPYNYASIMHYGRYAFTKNGYPTMVPKYTARIGLTYLHDLDVARVQKLYKCNKINTECKDVSNSLKCWFWWMKGYCDDENQIVFMRENCSKYCEFCW